MGQVLHGRARTTEEIRREIQNSQESLKVLAKRYGINEKTVLKWRHRKSVHDAPMGPKNPHSTVLTPEEEAACVAFRQQTLLPLDDCLYALQEEIPHLTRSSLHRCYQRHGISRLPKPVAKQDKKAFQTYPIGFFHIDIAEVRTEEGKLHLFVAIDRTSKFAYAELHGNSTRETATAFLENLIANVPYQIDTVLTDNGSAFGHPSRYRQGAKASSSRHMFDICCAEHNIEHRLTQPKHPWTNGQVERMNRTIKEATVLRYHYSTHAGLRTHLHAFLLAYNFAKRLKALKGLSPYQYVCKIWQSEPNRFSIDPHLFTVGLNT